MGRRSSLHEDFVRVKTPMGLERFQVENFLGLEKDRSFAPGPGGSPIEKCFVMIKGLPIGFNCTEGILASQNSYGFRVRFEAKNHFQLFPEQGE